MGVIQNVGGISTGYEKVGWKFHKLTHNNMEFHGG